MLFSNFLTEFICIFDNFQTMVLVIDPQIAGISGDMLLCSLVDLGADKGKILKGFDLISNYFHNAKISNAEFRKINKHGIQATELFLDIEETSHERKGIEMQNAILDIVTKIGLSDRPKLFAKSCIQTLINSESKIHGVPVESVHFHEASSIDTLIDIIGITIALEDLHLFDEEVICLPISVGGGSVTFSHGTMSNPASAIIEILKNSGLIIHGNTVKDELTTPTGASILVNLSNSSSEFYPAMQISSIGYGAGKKNFDSFSNVLKIIYGTKKNQFTKDTVKVLETNVDDVTGEILSNLIEKIMNKGAKDISIYPSITKKGRPSNLISIICDDEFIHEIVNILVSETGTLGIRISTSERLIIPREIIERKIDVEGKLFVIKYKIHYFNGKKYFKIEFDTLKEISEALNKSIKEIEFVIRKEIENIGE